MFNSYQRTMTSRMLWQTSESLKEIWTSWCCMLISTHRGVHSTASLHPSRMFCPHRWLSGFWALSTGAEMPSAGCGSDSGDPAGRSDTEGPNHLGPCTSASVAWSRCDATPEANAVSSGHELCGGRSVFLLSNVQHCFVFVAASAVVTLVSHRPTADDVWCIQAPISYFSGVQDMFLPSPSLLWPAIEVNNVYRWTSIVMKVLSK